MKGSKEMLTNPFHWHNTKCPFISYLQLFAQEGPAEPKEAHGASCDAWLHAPEAEGKERSPAFGHKPAWMGLVLFWECSSMEKSVSSVLVHIVQQQNVRNWQNIQRSTPLKNTDKILHPNDSFQMFTRTPRNYYYGENRISSLGSMCRFCQLCSHQELCP